MNKAQRHAAIGARAVRALENLYHNATPRYPRLDGEDAARFQSWFEDAAQCEIEYVAGGGAYGTDYHKTLEHSANAGRYKSEKARRYYVEKGLREYREDRQPWERISEYGKLYQWGRGGRTLAPDGLIKQHGGSSFSCREDYVDDRPIRDVVELIRIVESFNAYVKAWCESVPDMWAEIERERIREERAEKKRARDARRAKQAMQDRCEAYAG